MASNSIRSSVRQPSSKKQKSSDQENIINVSLNRNDNDMDDGGDPSIPSINERLGQLRPSRELLEYYRRKIADYDEEHEEMVQKLEDYKVAYEDQHRLQWELRQREEEIVELQKALSEMQVYLFQQREHTLRLYAENDRLKIRELEDKKKIQRLLMLSGVPEGEITYFMKEPPAKAIVEQKVPKKMHPNSCEGQKSNNKVFKKKSLPVSDRRRSMSPEPENRYYHDNETLSLQVESLQSQIEEQTKLAKEQFEALVEDRSVKDEEFETRRQRDEDKIRTLTDKLHKTQDLLYDSTKDFLELRYQGRTQERHWMGEKDQLLQNLDVCKQQLNISAKDTILNVSGGNYESRISQTEEIKTLEYQIQQSQKLCDMYREQVIQLEDELSRIREEGDVTREIFKGRSEKMSKRLNLMNSRYTELEQRRNLEVEGFKTDIKNLRGRLKDVERQLYKITVGFTEDLDGKRPDNIDMHILHNVRRTAGRSKKMMGDLKNLKSKVYSIENDLRHL